MKVNRLHLIYHACLDAVRRSPGWALLLIFIFVVTDLIIAFDLHLP